MQFIKIYSAKVKYQQALNCCSVSNAHSSYKFIMNVYSVAGNNGWPDHVPTKALKGHGDVKKKP